MKSYRGLLSTRYLHLIDERDIIYLWNGGKLDMKKIKNKPPKVLLSEAWRSSTIVE
jgi:hypothetical protein